MGEDGVGKTLIERLVTSPSAIATIVIALIGQAGFSIVYQIINNEHQSAEITANQQAIKTLTDLVNGKQTPLSYDVTRLEARITAIENAERSIAQALTLADSNLQARLDAIDRGGTRGLDAVIANQTRVIAQQERMGERFNAIDKRIGEVEGRAIIELQGRVEAVNAVIRRIEEQQNRIIQALDAQYNTLTEYIRANPGRMSPQKNLQLDNNKGK